MFRRKLPNLLLGLGAQKSGTTWLHANLKKHSAIATGFIKELHYFDAVHLGFPIVHRKRAQRLADIARNRPEVIERYFIGEEPKPGEVDAYKVLDACSGPLTDDWYIRQLTEEGKPWSMDITPEYGLLDQHGLKHARSLARNVKVILLLRDPVERAFSGMVHEAGKDIEAVYAMTEEQRKKRLSAWGIMERTNYVKMLQKARSIFGHDNVCVDFYDRVVDEPEALVERVLEFIGLETEAAVTADLGKRVHASPDYEFSDELKQHAFELHQGMVRELAGIQDIPAAWMERYDV